jgi:hypothetical protein
MSKNPLFIEGLSDSIVTVFRECRLNAWKDKLTAYNGKSITYDAIGNPLTYDSYTYTWQNGRQLAGISGNGLSTSYKYNASGIRTEKSVNGTTTQYHLVGNRVTYETDGTDEIYYIYNAQGDVIGLFSSGGIEVVTYEYDS